MAFKPLIQASCDECNTVFSCWTDSEESANLKMIANGWAVFDGYHYCLVCAKERFAKVKTSDYNEMFLFLDALAKGEGVPYPIESLLARLRGKQL